MKIKRNIQLAGSVGGNVGNGGGSIGGGNGSSGGAIGGNRNTAGGSIGGGTGNSDRTSRRNNSDCIIVNSFNKKEENIYIQKLRNWRDKKLSQSILGRASISTYYKVSPKLVRLSRRIPSIKKTVRATAIFIANLV